MHGPTDDARDLTVNEELEAFRTEMRRGFTEMRERLDRVDGRLDRVDGRLDTMDGRLDRMDGRLGRVDERVRLDGVLLEAIRDDVRQLAEAHVLLDQRVERYREENEAAHGEILTLLRTSYRDLERRVTGLEG